MTLHVSPPPKPTTPPFTGLPDNPAMVELKSRARWLLWDYVWQAKRQKWDKPPRSAKPGIAGSSTDPESWTDYARAEHIAKRDGLAGVGFALGDGEICGVDLDGCRDPETGDLQAWARLAVDLGETYAEVSPSGSGLRFFVRGRVDHRAVHAAQVELYADGRYLTVTGDHVAGTPLEIRTAPVLLAYLTERADQFRAAEQVASSRAREDERKRLERTAPLITERATASVRPSGSDFFGTVNERALVNADLWVRSLFPSATRLPSGVWRVTSRALGRDLEEDLSISREGIKDFGVHDMGDARAGGRSAIDLVMEHGGATDAKAAAFWLCDQLGVAPEDLGWKTRQAGGEAPRAESDAPPATERKRIRATPYVFRAPALIPPREWIYGRHLIRRFLSTTVAPGAVGKSSLVLVEAVAMATGRPLLGITPPQRMRVWYVNLEDPLEETERRVAAICLHYGIDGRELEGWLFLDSGRTAEIVIAYRVREGVKVAEPVIEDLTASMAENAIDHMVVDPFVSSHRVTENANDEIDIVAKAWNRVAEIANASIELVHHVRKGQSGQGEYTVEDGRGAGALLAAARSARVLNLMSKEQADKVGIPTHRGFFRVDNGKANLAPPPDRSEWFQLVSVPIGNGDQVAVVEPWAWPDPFEGVTTRDLRAAQSEVAGCAAAGARFRINAQAKDWIGIPIARALKLDHNDKAHRTKIAKLLAAWVEKGMFVVEDGKDGKGMPRQFVEVGRFASDTGD